MAMVRKFLDLDEAAKLLGLKPELLNEMRERREINAYRDGGHWKFRAEDIEKLQAERDQPLDEPADYAESPQDSVLLSEVEFGQSEPGTSSTIIGKSNVASPESDIRIAGTVELPPADASGVQLGEGSRGPGGSAVMPGASEILEGSTILGSIKPGGAAGPAAPFEDLDALDLELPTAASSGIHTGSSKKLKLDVPSDLTLEDEHLALGEEPVTAKPASDAGAVVELGRESDDDMVLGGGSSGSDITHQAGDSGISLVDPTDSGLSLDEPPAQLAAPLDSLELSDDDLILLEEPGETTGKVKADDDFLLTPSADSGGQESDSGSQVIALDSEFDESSATVLSSQPGGAAALLEEDLGGGLEAGMALGAGALAGGPALMMAARGEETDYSLWNIAGLSLCLLVLAFGGMLSFDLMRNMWSWDQPFTVNSSIAESVLSWFK